MTDDARIVAIQDTFWRATDRLLFQHTNPWELDEALVSWGFTMGPCEAQDLIGLDQVLLRQRTPVSTILSRMVAEGRLGKRGGVGYYRYPGRGGAVIDPLIEDLIREEAWFAGTSREDLSEEALIEDVLDVLRDVMRQLQESEITKTDIAELFSRALHFPQKAINLL